MPLDRRIYPPVEVVQILLQGLNLDVVVRTLTDLHRPFQDLKGFRQVAERNSQSGHGRSLVV
jgi:hypothetical protein